MNFKQFIFQSLIALGCLLLITSSTLSVKEIYTHIQIVDKRATKETKSLFYNLKKLAPSHILFGHEDALAYGVKWKNWHKQRSDIKDVCGQHPAVFGWEMSKLGKSDYNIDSVSFKAMKGWMKEVYKMGGVNTISWHMDQFEEDKNSWQVGERVVEDILPGGKNHEQLKEKLDLFANFINDLKVGFIFKKEVPIILRMWHEHSGSWFWWGKDWCTAEEYKALYQFTVRYLRDEKGLHNILYCYSPDVVESKQEYLERYPGDAYVDIIGMDIYRDFKKMGNPEDLPDRLKMIVEIAEEKGKIAALSETGFETIPQNEWWTKTFLRLLKQDKKGRNIAYAMVWRNGRSDHFYAPHPDHPSALDFIRFVQDDMILLEKEIPDLYKIRR